MTSSKKCHLFFTTCREQYLEDTQAPNADEIDNPGDTPIAGVTVELFNADAEW